jgi:SAM-dependent methyltransferase
MNKERIHDKMREVSGGVINRYQEYLAHISQSDKMRERNMKAGHHNFVPTRGVNELIKALIKLKERIHKSTRDWNPPKFLDAGCGVGNIMTLASKVGYTVYGIEYNPEIARIAKRLSGGDVCVGDITTYTQYDKYDVIFYYVPIIDKVKMDKFCDTLAHQMKRGAYIIPTGYKEPFYDNEIFKRVPNEKFKCWVPMFQKVGKYVTPEIKTPDGRIVWRSPR